MKYWNSYHIFFDTYLDYMYDKVTPLIEEFLAEKNYSFEVENLDTIINCSPGWDFKQRSKFRRKEKLLFFDIIIDYDFFMSLTNAGRRECVAQSFLRDMEVLKNYKPKDFKFDEMRQDFKNFFQEIGWLLPDE